MIAAVTDHDVTRALTLSDAGVLLLLVLAVVTAVLWRAGVWDRKPPNLVDGSGWEPEPPRVVPERPGPFDQDEDVVAAAEAICRRAFTEPDGPAGGQGHG